MGITPLVPAACCQTDPDRDWVRRRTFCTRKRSTRILALPSTRRTPRRPEVWSPRAVAAPEREASGTDLPAGNTSRSPGLDENDVAAETPPERRGRPVKSSARASRSSRGASSAGERSVSSVALGGPRGENRCGERELRPRGSAARPQAQLSASARSGTGGSQNGRDRSPPRLRYRGSRPELLPRRGWSTEHASDLGPVEARSSRAQAHALRLPAVGPLCGSARTRGAVRIQLTFLVEIHRAHGARRPFSTLKKTRFPSTGNSGNCSSAAIRPTAPDRWTPPSRDGRLGFSPVTEIQVIKSMKAKRQSLQCQQG
jgi:hypothetical protein